jgi:hypothetical protein
MNHNPKEDRYGRQGPTAVEKGLGILLGTSVSILAFELAYHGYLGSELRDVAGYIAVGLNNIFGFIDGTYHFLRGDLQVRDGAGLVEIFQAISRNQPHWDINPAIGKPFGDFMSKIVHPIDHLTR